MSSQTPRDFTPDSGGPTDVAPLGRSGPKPPHEQTAGEGPQYDWEAIANEPAFAELQAAKRRFIVPGTIFFLAYYMALPILVGFFPAIMKATVIGKINWAYLFALSQFIMTWALSAIYVRTAHRWDEMNAALLAKYIRP